QPPEFINGYAEFEPYMELDMLFRNFTFETPFIQVITNDVVGGRPVLNCTFAQMDATAYRLAAILADARYRLNTEGLAEKLETADLPESIDRELLLKTLLHTASEGLNKAEDFIESEIRREAEVFAKRMFRVLVDYDARDTNSNEFRAKFEPFQRTVEQLLRKNIESAGAVINEMGISKFAEFFSVNIVPARGFTSHEVENFLKELPPLDNTVTLELFGNNFTRDGLEQRIDRIKSLLGQASPFTL
ncbi:MAG: hypothetical protein FWF80_03825, partial [Defluviitaleaceae bacterium]|nr:hypothetical protein [Defluviitaleaceae bacterium]